jgi:multisubunit Na+/H+ antiporter MnhE subunit
MRRLALSTVTLTVVYALTLGSRDPWDLLIGALLAVGLLLLFRPVTIGHHPVRLPGLLDRTLGFLPFAGHVAADILVSTWKAALVILGVRSADHAAIVAVPILERTHRGIAVTALVTTVAPGSYFIRVDWDRQVMLFHFLDARDRDRIRRELERSYSRYLRRVVP